MNSGKIEASVKGYRSALREDDGNYNFNDNTLTSLKTKYEILEENFANLLKIMAAGKKDFSIFDNNKEDMMGKIDGKARDLEDTVESSIAKMDGEIQKSISQQKEENSRLEQQIMQLGTDENIIKNQLMIVQRRIDDIQLQIGQIGFK